MKTKDLAATINAGRKEKRAVKEQQIVSQGIVWLSVLLVDAVQ